MSAGICGIGRARLIFGVMAAALMAISMSGCATIISGTRQKIDIRSEQEGASVVIDNIRDKKVFESKNLPETARLKRGAGYFKSSEYSVKMSKEGYDTLTATIESNVNLIPYLGNIYTGGLIGMIIIDPASGAMWKLDADILEADFDKGIINRYPRTDGYFAARYMVPVGVDLEWGSVWGKGMFFGIDIGGGINNSMEGFGVGGFLGGGFSLGSTYDLLVADLKLVYGGSAGFWYGSGPASSNKNNPDPYYSSMDNSYDEIAFLGPFVRLRWKFLELSYRGLLSLHQEDLVTDDSKHGIGWNSQISLGVYFESNKRWKPKDKR